MSSIPGPHEFNPNDCDECLNSPIPVDKIVTHTDWDNDGRLVRVDPLNIVGLDLSLSSTGVADSSGTRTFGYSVKKGSHWTAYAERLKKLGVLIDRATQGADLIVIEAPAYGSANSGYTMGTLHGIVQVLMFQRRRTVVYLGIQKLKQFACNHGAAPKDAVLAAAIRDGSPARGFDEADAWWLRRIALHAYSSDVQALPIYRQNVIGAVTWPNIREKGAV